MTNDRHSVNSGHEPPPLTPAQALDSAYTDVGGTLGELSETRPLLLVFLRHMGCTFCREALADLKLRRAEIESAGASIAVVHMSEPAVARATLHTYGLGDVPAASDPERRLYRAFELRRGSLFQLFGPRVWLRGFIAGILAGHGVGRLQGDGFQMPGAFLVHKRRIIRAYRHATAADRPDYCELATTTA